MASDASPPTKRQKKADSGDAPPYELLYWPGIPGRGEHVRLCFEEAGVPYTDTAQIKDGVKSVVALMKPTHLGEGDNPPIFAPPILRHGELTINQTPNILLYLGPKLGLVPDESEDEFARYRINELALTALDGFSNEVHDCHHPVATGDYYENQKEEAVKKSQDYVSVRLPKFLGYFERVLQSKASGNGPWLYGGRLSYADLVLFQTMSGTTHQFPKAVAKWRASKKFDRVFALYDAVQERPKIKEYLASDRRQAYGNGIYRHYDELDIEPKE